MQSNPILRRLGFADDERVVILHADDVGMCQASVAAFADLYDFGLLSSGAVMTPCPWFLQVAAFARQHPDADLGVHLTLTSEWKTYRWGPLSTRDPLSGLIDEEGYFYHLTHQAQEHGQPESVQCEIETQLARTLAAGMQPTHIDTHMGVLASAKFMASYMRLAIANRLPAMIFRQDEAGYRAAGLSTEDAARAAALVQQMDSLGVPMLDHLRGLHLPQPDQRLEQAKAALAELPPGITHFIIHPSQDSPELRAITDRWPSRVADYQTFMREDLRAYIRDLGIQVIGYRAVQQLMPDPAVLAGLLG